MSSGRQPWLGTYSLIEVFAGMAAISSNFEDAGLGVAFRFFFYLACLLSSVGYDVQGRV